MASALRQVLDDPIGQPQRIPIYRNEPEFIDRINNPQNYPVIQNPDGSVSTHRMAAESDSQGNFYVFPTIQMEDGRLVEYEDNRQAMDAAFRSGNILRAPNMLSALRYAEGGYKQGTPLAEDQQAARRELENRGVNPDEVAQAPVPSNQSVMAAPTSINPFNPAFRETARSFLNNYFGGSNIAGREGYRTGQLVDTAVGAMDFAPAIGDAIGVGDLRQSISARDPAGIAINSVAMLPLVGTPAAKVLKKGRSALRETNPNLDQSYEARMQRAQEQGYKPGLYHGAVTDISEFDISRGTPESHMGMGVYTTTGAEDANRNYATVSGPDISNKISQRVDELESELELTDEAAISRGYADANEMYFDIASQEISTNQGVVYPLMGRSSKPFDISEGNDTFLSYEYPEFDPKDYLDEAGGDMELAEDLARDDSYNFEPEGELTDFLGSIRRNLSDEEYEKVATSIMESAYDGGISGKELEDIYRKAEIYAEDDLGRFNQMEIFRQGLEDAGFDSIIHDADRFNMPNVEGQKHQIFFRENQLRSPSAEFDPQNIDSADLLSSRSRPMSALRGMA